MGCALNVRYQAGFRAAHVGEQRAGATQRTGFHDLGGDAIHRCAENDEVGLVNSAARSRNPSSSNLCSRPSSRASGSRSTPMTLAATSQRGQHVEPPIRPTPTMSKVPTLWHRRRRRSEIQSERAVRELPLPLGRGLRVRGIDGEASTLTPNPSPPRGGGFRKSARQSEKAVRRAAAQPLELVGHLLHAIQSRIFLLSRLPWSLSGTISNDGIAAKLFLRCFNSSTAPSR